MTISCPTQTSAGQEENSASESSTTTPATTTPRPPAVSEARSSATRTPTSPDPPEFPAFPGSSGPHPNQPSLSEITSNRVIGMQKWEGRIIEIYEDLLTVELSPLDHEGPTLVADFDLQLLAPDDAIAQTGDTVYLTVRTVVDKGRYRTVTSSLRLARLGRWSKEDIEHAKDSARAELRSLLEHVD